MVGRPFTRTRPAVGFSRPLISLASVDFPEPLGPNRAVNSPSRISRVTRSRALVSRLGITVFDPVNQYQSLIRSNLSFQGLTIFLSGNGTVFPLIKTCGFIDGQGSFRTA